MNDQDTTTLDVNKGCPYCSGPGTVVNHAGYCPRIKVMEYYENGSLKRVELEPRSSSEILNNAAEWVEGFAND